MHSSNSDYRLRPRVFWAAVILSVVAGGVGPVSASGGAGRARVRPKRAHLIEALPAMPARPRVRVRTYKAVEQPFYQIGANARKDGRRIETNEAQVVVSKDARPGLRIEPKKRASRQGTYTVRRIRDESFRRPSSGERSATSFSNGIPCVQPKDER
jgi:hypothetical protein